MTGKKLSRTFRNFPLSQRGRDGARGVVGKWNFQPKRGWGSDFDEGGGAVSSFIVICQTSLAFRSSLSSYRFFFVSGSGSIPFGRTIIDFTFFPDPSKSE